MPVLYGAFIETSMKVGVISDTHLGNDPSCRFPSWVLEAFQGVKMIFHAGDITHENVLEELQTLAPVIAVRGNMDSNLDNLPPFRIFPIPEGFAVICHRLNDAYKLVDSNVKLVVYGHSHIPKVEIEKGILYLNPGSPTVPRGGNPPSVAIVRFEKGVMEPIFKYSPSNADI